MKSVILSFLLFVFGCSFFPSGKDPKEAALATALAFASPGDVVGSARIGSSGGTIASYDGKIEVLVPAGAVPIETDFKITRYDLESSALPGKYFPVSQAYKFEPDFRFEKEVQVRIQVDLAHANSLNLNVGNSQGFISSHTRESNSSARLTKGWSPVKSTIENGILKIRSKTFSVFAAGSPPPGNLAPVITGLTYHFKPGLSYVPYQVRVEAVDPDSDPIQLRLLVGKPTGALNGYPLVQEGSTNFYSLEIPLEAYTPSGLRLQVIAVDSYGNVGQVPNSVPYSFPADTADPLVISGYNLDQDSDGYNDLWELSNLYDPSDDLSPGIGLFADADGDLVPDASDPTPNPGDLPTVDSIAIYPKEVLTTVGDPIQFSVSGSNSGSPVFLDSAIFTQAGIGINGANVGTISGSIFTPVYPGIATITSLFGIFTDTATVQIADTIGPNAITNLTATAVANTKIRLNWTAPGNNGNVGSAAAYEIRISSGNISSDALCDSASSVFSGLAPKQAGLSEVYYVSGLSPNTLYYFCIRAYDSAGNRNSWTGTGISARTYPTPDLTPPADITNLTTTVLSDSQIRLNWTAVGNDGNTGAAASYEIRYSGNAIISDQECSNALEVLNSLGSVANGTALNFTVSSLGSASKYYFCVRAFDPSGNRSSWSGDVHATTLRKNQAPVVVIASIPIVSPTTTVTLDASGSYDLDATVCGGTTLTYVWRFVSAPPGSAINQIALGNPAVSTKPIALDLAGDYIFRVEVTDNQGTCVGGAQTSIGTIKVEVR